MKKIILFASLALASLSVSAATITGTSSGVFVNPQGPGVPTHVDGVGTNSLSWGQGALISQSCFFGFCWNQNYSDPSSLTYNGGGFSGEVGDNLQVGTMNFANGTIYAGTEASSVDFNLTLDFATPFNESALFTYNFALENTINPLGDSVILLNGGDPTKFFTYAGQDYYFSLLGFKVGNSILDEIYVKELKDKTFKLVGQITTSEVPLPAAVWLFGSGLIGFMAMRRRAKLQAV